MLHIYSRIIFKNVILDLRAEISASWAKSGPTVDAIGLTGLARVDGGGDVDAKIDWASGTRLDGPATVSGWDCRWRLVAGSGLPVGSATRTRLDRPAFGSAVLRPDSGVCLLTPILR